MTEIDPELTLVNDCFAATGIAPDAVTGKYAF
jgi:hypothetical protein